MRFILPFLVFSCLASSPSHAQVVTASPKAQGAAYIENMGQLPPQVLYRADFGTVALFAEKGCVSWSKLQDDVGELVHEQHHKRPEERAPFMVKGHAWRMTFEESDVEAVVEAEGRSSATLNYFIGNDATKWVSNVRYYKAITYRDAWPGVDVRLHGGEGGFKYDVLLDQAADVGLVRFAYEGLNALVLDEEGRLMFNTHAGMLMEMRPVAWYADGAKEEVPCRFTLKSGTVGFEFAEGVVQGRPVVIDPLLIASTLSGTGNIGTTENYGHTATYDAAGNIYTGAICFGQGYPATVGAFDLTYGSGGGGFGTDIAISKLNPDGSNLLWAPYIGGDDSDYPHSLVVNAANELTVLGSSESSDYPVSASAFDPTANGGADIVLSKLDPTGAVLVGSTYVGGTGDDGRNYLTFNYGDDYRGEVITDAAGNVYVSSCTRSVAFPTTAGAYQGAPGGLGDGVLFCLSPNLGAMNWATCIGSTGEDVCFGLKLDGSGGVFACGATGDAGFPTTAGAYQSALLGGEDAFVVHVTGGGTTLAQSTLFGGASGADDAFFIELDLNGNVYIYGQTNGGIAIAPAGTYGQANGDLFLAKFDPTLTTTVFTSTIGPGGFGGSGGSPIAFLVDVCDHIYISCHGQLGGISSGMPITANALQTTGGFYLAAFDVDMGGLLFGSYYGDIADHVDGGTSRFDANGIVYQGVCTGGGFPTTAWAWSNVQPFGWDIGVFKIDFQVAGVNAAGGSNINTGCAPITIDFLNTSTGNLWLWDFGDGSPLDNTYTPSHTYTTPGAYTVTLIAYDSLTCNLADTITFPITIGVGAPITAAFTAVQDPDCTSNQVVTTNTSTGSPIAFLWDMGDGSPLLTDTNVVYDYGGAGSWNIELLVYDPTGCSPPDSLTLPITILPPVTFTAAFTVTQTPDCSALIVQTDNQTPGTTATFQWDMGDGTLYYTTDVSHTYTTAGTYTITLIANDPNTCNQLDTVTAQVQVTAPTPISAAFTATQVFDCLDLLVQTTNTSAGSFVEFLWDMGDGTQSTDSNVTHTYSGAGTYDITLVAIDSLGCTPNDTAIAQVTIDPLVPVVAGFATSQTGDCTTLTIVGTNWSTGDSVSYSWDMGDGTILTTTDVSHVYTAPGTYTVTLTVTDLGCGQDDTFSQPVQMVTEMPTALVPDTVLCFGTTVMLDGTSPGATNYIWSTGETTPMITIDAGGQYWVQVSSALCSGADTVNVVEGTDPQLSYELAACPNEHLDLEVPMAGQSYSWSSGGDERIEHVIGDGTWTFTVIDFLGCPHTDTVVVHPLDEEAMLFAPNAFTPDGDGINEVFTVVGFGEERMELMIFDRWGEHLFTTTDMAKPWNGSYSGGLVKQDVYVYRLKYNSHCDPGKEKTVYGHVSVLH